MDQTWERTRASMRGSWAALADLAEGGIWIEDGGVGACVYPAAPERSIFNAVVWYEDAAALERAHDRLRAAYEDAGVQAWTVWVPEHDADAAALLASAGHVLDADPANMLLDLRQFHAPDPTADVSWGCDATLEEWARVNEAAYPWGDGSMERAILAMSRAPGPVYAVREDGEAVAVLGAEDHNGDCYITLVATLPEWRGLGYAGLLMNEALRDAKARGCSTSSLQATKKGEPVYARVGYRTLGAFQMWERRSP